MSIRIENYNFEFVCDILPETNDEGRIVELYPQDNYKQKDIVKLHKYGNGPFCKFKIPNYWAGKHGVYAILLDEHIEYIGECEDLSARYNAGYGNISPRNCYIGGQSTNCKVNHNILCEVKSGKSVKLFFHETSDRFAVEDLLIEKLNPLWNSKSGNKRKQSFPSKQTAPANSVSKERKQRSAVLNYGLLTEYLLTIKTNEEKLTFDHLEQIIKNKLPNSAYNYKAWWANGGHSHADYWLKTGWKVEDISLGKYVVFSKEP